MTVFVVVSHIKLVLLWSVDGRTGLCLDPNLLFDGGGVLTRLVVAGRVLLWGGVSGVGGRVGRLVLPTRRGVFFGDGLGAGAVVSLSYVDVTFENSSRAVGGTVFTVVDTVLDVDLSVGVPLIWLPVSNGEQES